MAEPILLIMAAGMGTRYSGLKQIDPVGPNGEIIIDYSIYDAIRAGFKKLVFVIHPHFEDAFNSQFHVLATHPVGLEAHIQATVLYDGPFRIPTDIDVSFDAPSG